MSLGMTIAEKILARCSGQSRVIPGDIVVAKVDRLLITGRRFAEFAELAGQVWEPERVVVVFDHVAPPPTVAAANYFANARKMAKQFGIEHWYEIGKGVCHQVFLEEGFARPGELLVGSDSHTCTAGAFNVAARGINAETPYVLAHGETWFRVPESIKFVLKGQCQAGVYAKDVVLHIARTYGDTVGLNRSIEFTGPGLAAMSLDERIIFSNMGIELGAKFAIQPADATMMAYVSARTTNPLRPVDPDEGAVYVDVYELDMSTIPPLFSCPHEVGHVKSVEEITPVKVDQAFIGSCANGRYGDLEQAAQILKGRKTHPNTRLLVTPASKKIFDRALASGIIKILSDAGAIITSPDCGPCPGFHMGLLADGEVCVASQNRNYKGRMGSSSARIYLGSAASVAAAAIEGRLADPRKYLEGIPHE